MRIKPITIVALIGLIIAGVSFYSDKVSTSKQTTVADTQAVKASPTTPPATPNRELKPNERFIGTAGL